MREKLIELIGQVQDFGCDVSDVVEINYIEDSTLADHLIANGVTIQKWIPVTERLPEDAEKVLVLTKCTIGKDDYTSWLVRYNRKKGAFYDYDSEWGNIKIPNVTHWMPLPEPPKGE